MTSGNDRRAAVIVLGRSDQAEGWTSWSEDFISPPLPPLLMIEGLRNNATEDFLAFGFFRFLRAELCFYVYY